MGSNTSQPAKYDTPAYACINTYLILTTIAIVARGTSRYLSKASFAADDALAYLAYITNAASLINYNTFVSMGTFDLPRQIAFSPEQLAHYATIFKRGNIAGSVLYIVSITTAKLSVMFLFRRIFRVYTGWYRSFWWFNFVVIFPVWAFATLGILIWAQLDQFSFEGPAAVYGSSAVTLVNAISDIMVLILPISGVLKLQLPRAQKAGVIGLFSLGFLTTMVSLARAVLSFQQAVTPPQWNPAYSAYNYMMLAAAESSAACLCACIPVAKPFFWKAGELASRSLNISSLRAIVSRSSLSTKASQNDNYESSSEHTNNKDAISRTVDIDMESMPLRKSTSVERSLHQPHIVGYTENHESPATTRAWA